MAKKWGKKWGHLLYFHFFIRYGAKLSSHAD